MKETDYFLLIHKSVSGEISEQEMRTLESWLALSSENTMLFKEIKLIWDNSGPERVEKNLPYDPEEELLLLQQRIKHEKKGAKKRHYLPRVHNKTNLLKIAAVVLLLIISNLLTWQLFHLKEDNFPEVKNGQNINELFLPDGSKVYLNKNTTFSFNQSNHQREVRLTGEAYFKVSKDESRPFIVHLPNALVKVIGTSFNINAKSDTTMVTVISGLVEVFNGSKSIKIGPHERVVISGKTQKLTKRKNSDPNFDSWKTGILKFDNTEMRSILALLEDHFSISFKVQNKSILSCRFTGTFENDRLEKVLEVLSYGLDFEYRFYNDQYILSGKGCERSK